MDLYKLVKIGKRKSNKTGKEYYIAFLNLIMENDVQVVRIMVQEKQVEALNKVIKDINFDISKYVEVKYNSYQNCYQPTLTYGL